MLLLIVPPPGGPHAPPASLTVLQALRILLPVFSGPGPNCSPVPDHQYFTHHYATSLSYLLRLFQISAQRLIPQESLHLIPFPNMLPTLPNLFIHCYIIHWGFPGDSEVKDSTCQCRRCRFNPWVGKIPWRRKWQPTLVFLLGEFHGWRSLVGYSPRGRKESDTTE